MKLKSAVTQFIMLLLILTSPRNAYCWSEFDNKGFTCSGTKDCQEAGSLVALAAGLLGFTSIPLLFKPKGSLGGIAGNLNSFEAGFSPSGVGNGLFRTSYYGWAENRLGIETSIEFYHSPALDFLALTPEANFLYSLYHVPYTFRLSMLAGGTFTIAQRLSASRFGFPLGVKLDYNPKPRINLRAYFQYVPMFTFTNRCVVQTFSGYTVDQKTNTNLFISHRLLRGYFDEIDHIFLAGVTVGF